MGEGGTRHSCRIFPQDSPYVQQLTLRLALPALPIRSGKQETGLPLPTFCPSQEKPGKGSLCLAERLSAERKGVLDSEPMNPESSPYCST